MPSNWIVISDLIYAPNIDTASIPDHLNIIGESLMKFKTFTYNTARDTYNQSQYVYFFVNLERPVHHLFNGSFFTMLFHIQNQNKNEVRIISKHTHLNSLLPTLFTNYFPYTIILLFYFCRSFSHSYSSFNICFSL